VKLEVQAKALQLLSVQASTPTSDKFMHAIQTIVNPFEYWHLLRAAATEKVSLEIEK
jgi:hypothetical protein